MSIVVLTAVVVRLVAVVHFRSYDIPPERDHWDFGFEAGRIARSLATGQGYSSAAMVGPTAPTGFLAPVFPFLLAGIFKMFGIYTAASAIAVYILDTLLSALTCIALYGLGARVFGSKIGLTAAFLFALYPSSIWYASGTIWDTTLLTCVLVVLMYCLYGLPLAPSPAELARVGLLMGFVVLINPAPAVIYPVAVVWVWFRQLQSTANLRNSLRGAATVTLSCGLVCLPWMIRNAIMVGEFAPRTSTGLQVRLGNNQGAWKSHNGNAFIAIYPGESVEEAKRLIELGEAGYDHYCARLGIEFIRQNPQKFLDLTWWRVRGWWFGNAADWTGNLKTSFRLANLKRLMSISLTALAAIGCVAAWRSRKPSGLLQGLIIVYPIPYYFLFVNERYRYPTDAFLLLFAACGLVGVLSVALRRVARARDRRASTGLGNVHFVARDRCKPCASMLQCERGK
jgi:hypothetical protein